MRSAVHVALPNLWHVYLYRVAHPDEAASSIIDHNQAITRLST